MSTSAVFNKGLVVTGGLSGVVFRVRVSVEPGSRVASVTIHDRLVTLGPGDLRTVADLFGSAADAVDAEVRSASRSKE